MRPAESPDPPRTTAGDEYADRLVDLQTVWWKRLLPVQAPYRWNLRRLKPGFTLDIGCGLGRNLAHLKGNGVGVDHNPALVAVARERRLTAYTTGEFPASEHAIPEGFDTVLAAHLVEHMRRSEAVEILASYMPYLRPGGQAILITPQERGFAADATHVEFAGFDEVREVCGALGLEVTRAYSFPFPRRFGRLFVYNEFVTVAHKSP
ncbi:MAG TPA: class I SAM-dependent methyltransferase [Acidimicrobiia bacterium]|nr:class I SAM-dependent methyltransferase [Acidimicrobiia bacterium]